MGEQKRRRSEEADDLAERACRRVGRNAEAYRTGRWRGNECRILGGHIAREGVFGRAALGVSQVRHEG